MLFNAVLTYYVQMMEVKQHKMELYIFALC